MQQPPSKSNLIRQTETAKKKARRKLIGSIFLLFVALIILLNVTARVKPIPVNPETIEIKNTTNTQTNVTEKSTSASAGIAQNITTKNSSLITQNASTNSTATANQTVKATSSATIQASIISKENSSSSVIATESKNSFDLATLKPIIISDVIKHKPTPDEILEGKAETTKPVYFVLLISLNEKKSANEVHQQLLENDIHSTIQTTIVNKKPMYRLRIGPFLNKDMANKRLTEIKNKLGNDI